MNVDLIHGAPSHDAFRHVFMMIKPAALLEIDSEWVGFLQKLHIRIDVKIGRGAEEIETRRSRLHLLRAWVWDVGLSVGQNAYADKSNEWASLPDFLGQLELKGALVSIHVMAGDPEAVQMIQ